MNIESLRKYCLSLKGATEGLPFGEDALVFKIGGKMFALTSLEGPLWVNLKCDPEEAIELREKFPQVTPGYHMNKKHWNTVNIDDTIPDKLIHEWIDESYRLVVSSLPRKVRNEIESS